MYKKSKGSLKKACRHRKKRSPITLRAAKSPDAKKKKSEKKKKNRQDGGSIEPEGKDPFLFYEKKGERRTWWFARTER